MKTVLGSFARSPILGYGPSIFDLVEGGTLGYGRTVRSKIKNGSESLIRSYWMSHPVADRDPNLIYVAPPGTCDVV